MRLGLIPAVGMLTLVGAGCADPCADDGFGQEACPAGSGTEAGTESAGPESATATEATQTESNSNSATMTDTIVTDSNSGDDTDSSGTDSSASATGTTTGVSATLTDGSSSTGTVSATDSSSDTDSSTSSTGSTSMTTMTGSTDGDTELYCLDMDGDGFGNPDECMQVDPDNPPPDTVPADVGDDCDDDDLNTYPGAAPLDDADACMTDEDMDDYGDNQPGPGVTPGTDCDDNDAAIQTCALLVTQDGTTDLSYDEQLMDSLQAAGLGVIVLADTDATAADAQSVSLLVISETANSPDVLGEFRDVTVPAIVLEGLIWDDMDMAPEGSAVSSDDANIALPAHPLAGGLMGEHDLIDGVSAGLFHTNPSDDAAEVATRPGNANQVVLFGFDVGGIMENAFAAPARRVGLGLDADQNVFLAATLTDSGQTLFEAAIAWALQ